METELSTPDPAAIDPALAHLAQPIDTYQPHPENPNEGDVGAMTLSLQQFGQYRAAVVQQSTGYVVAGNTMLAAARALGWGSLAFLVRDMDDTYAKALALTDNRQGQLARLDPERVLDWLQQVASAMPDMIPSTGYDLDWMDDTLAELGRVPVLPPTDVNAPTSPDRTEGVDRVARQPAVRYRDVVLMVPEREWEWFSAAVAELAKDMELRTTTDVVMRVVAAATSRPAPEPTPRAADQGGGGE